MVRKLASFLGEYKKYAILTPIVIIGEVLMEVMIPFIMAGIIDKGINGDGGVKYIITMGAIMVVMAFISLGFGALGGKLGAIASMGFGKNIRKALFEKVQEFSFSNIDKFSTASLITRLTTDITNTQNAFMMLIRLAVRAPIMLIGAISMSIVLNAKLSLVLLFAIPVLGVSLVIIMTKAHPRFGAMLTRYDHLNAVVQENLIGIRVVKAFVRQDFENEKFQYNANEVRKAQLRAEKLVILNGPIMQITMYISIVAVVWFGGNMVINGSFEVGKLSSFITYVTQILISLMALSMVLISLVISRASIQRIVEVLDEEIEIPENSEGYHTVSDGSIEFHNVFFSYNKSMDNVVLEDVNISIQAGETVGIIGGTGSSKTTLVQLIPRLYDVLDGEILVGGKNVKEYALSLIHI